MLELFAPFVSPSSRVYWPALLCFGLVYVWWYRSVSWRTFWHSLQTKSTQLDVQLLIVNQAWRSMLLTSASLLAWQFGLGVVQELDLLVGRVTYDVSMFWMMSMYSLTLFVVEDLSRFLLHVAMHRVPWLWQIHQVHHSATHLTPLTFFRIHPLESLLYYARSIVSTGLVAGVFFWLFRTQLLPWQLIGVPATGLLLNVFFGNLRHSSIFLRFPNWLERWFISPAQHQLHHSAETQHWHANYGTWLAIWDRWCGSLIISDAPPTAYGLPDTAQQDLITALFAPLKLWQPARKVAIPLMLLLVVGLFPLLSLAEEPSQEQSETSEDSESDAQIIVYGDNEQIQEAGSAHRVDEAILNTFEMNDIQQVMTFVPGVSTRNEDGFGLRPNIGIRGANSDRSAKVTLMEDGVLFAPAPYAAPAAYFFPMTTRLIGVEVFKGAASTRYGPQTVGGAVNLITRSIPDEGSITSDVSFGGFQTLKGHVSAGTTTKNGLGMLTEVAHLQSDGFKELASGESTGFDRTEFMQKFRVGESDNAVTLKLGYAREKSHETYLGLSGRDFDENPLLRYPASQKGLMSWQRTQGELAWRFVSDKWVHRAVGYHHFLDRSWTKLNGFASGVDLHNLLLQDPSGGEGAIYMSILRGETDSLMPEEMLRIGTNARQFHSFGIQHTAIRDTAWTNGHYRLEFGTRVHGDLVKRLHTEREASMTGGRVTYTDGNTETLLDTNVGAIALSAYIHNDIALSGWHLFPSVRQEVIQTTANSMAWSAPITRSITLPGMGILHEINDWTDVFAGAHRGFSPVAPEQAETVQPEQSWNYEAGFRHHTDMFHVEVIGFVNDYQRITGQCTLSSGCDPNDLGKQFTGGRAVTSGLETSYNVEWLLPNGWTIPAHGQYSYTHAIFQQSFTSGFSQFGVVTKGDALPYVARHQGAISIGLDTENTTVSVHSAYRGRMLDAADVWSTTSDATIPSIWTTDVAITQHVWSNLDGYLTVNNLLDARQVASWRPFGARPIAPRTVFVGVKWNGGA